MRILILSLLLLAAVALCAQDSLSTYRTGDNNLFLSPTANVLPDKASSFGVQYFIVLNYTMNLLPRFEVSAYCPFPFSNEFANYFTLHAKYQFLNVQDGKIKVALGAKGVPTYGIGSIGSPVSIYQNQFGFHFTPLCTYREDEYVFGFNAGLTVNIDECSQLVYEFANADLYNNRDVLDSDENADLLGMTAMGFRRSGTSLSWELGLIHPDFEDGDWVAFPYFACSWTWGL